MEHDICQLFKKDNAFLEYVMAQLEAAGDMLYNENLPACEYINVKSRYDTLIEIRDKYCEQLNKRK